MNLSRMVAFSFCLIVTLVCGCTRSSPTIKTERHYGPRVNIGDLVSHTANYKGKTMNLVVKIDEPIVRGKGQSLRDFAGRDVKFMALGANGERADLVIRIPQG